MVVDVGESGESQRVAGPDLRAQRPDIGLGGAVAPFVLGLGVDHEAVGAVGDRLGAEVGLTDRIGAVDVLPCAHLQAVRVQALHELGGELGPVVARAVGALDEQRAHPGGVGLGDDRGDVAAVGLAQVPDPHALPVEGGAARRAGTRGAECAREPGALGRGRVKRVAHHVDRPVGARVVPVAEQHHDVPRVRAAGDARHQAQRRVTQARTRRGAADASAAGAGKGHDHPRLQAAAREQQRSAGRYLMRIAAAPGGGHATGARDPGRGEACPGRGLGAARCPLAVRGRGAGGGRAARVGGRGRARRGAEAAQQQPEDCRGQEAGPLVHACTRHDPSALENPCPGSAAIDFTAL